MATKYLDYNGLLYFWGLIKAKLGLKADAQTISAGSYGTANDTSATLGGTFKIPYVTVTSQGVVSAIADKTITLPSPTTISGYGITDAYTKTEIDNKLTSAMHYKGSVANVADLPSTNNAVGDFYNVTATGENYAWTGSAWDVTGSIVDLAAITNGEIDTVVAS